MFCKFGNCRLLVFPVIYLFFPLLSLLPVLATDSETTGRFPQIKHTFDILFPFLVLDYHPLIKYKLTEKFDKYDQRYKNSITESKFQVFFSEKMRTISII